MNRRGIILTLTLALFAALTVFGQTPQRTYTVMFYNLENLFDTINDPDVHDEEFTPQGAKKWNGIKYWKKQHNIEKVLYDISRTVGDYPAVIGVSEIENRNVLEDIVAAEKLLKGDYRIVHYDSPDARGVDVAFLYRPSRFKLEGSKAHKTVVEGLPDFKTRDIVTMWGTIEDEPFFFMVNHWPSRLGGQAASEPKRCSAAAQVKHIADSVLAQNPATKIIIMGDMNDDPTDKSMMEMLGASKTKIKDLQKGELYNPYLDMYRKGKGTLAYQDAWNLFDNMVVSENLVTDPKGKLKLLRAEDGKFYGNIFRASYLFQKEGQYKGYPLRTFVGNNFQNGYSDHLPVYLLISK